MIDMIFNRIALNKEALRLLHEYASLVCKIFVFRTQSVVYYWSHFSLNTFISKCCFKTKLGTPVASRAASNCTTSSLLLYSIE